MKRKSHAFFLKSSLVCYFQDPLEIYKQLEVNVPLNQQDLGPKLSFDARSYFLYGVISIGVSAFGKKSRRTQSRWSPSLIHASRKILRKQNALHVLFAMNIGNKDVTFSRWENNLSSFIDF